MKKIFLLCLALLALLNVKAQSNALYRPFYSGVASGDPLANAIIIWTRITPENAKTPVVKWLVTTDTALKNVVKSGSFETSAKRDYTVKVDVTGLKSNTTYYYQFEYEGWTSLIGRTKTAPIDNEAGHQRFAVVSCSNFQAGFFNAYGRIADRNDLTAVIHLGDYIYEYPNTGYGDSVAKAQGRKHDSLETIKVEQYRARYNLYRLDSNLRRLHQQHPMICVWDDHESANNSHKNGAQNHTEGMEGKWSDRKSFSRQAYQEWMPIREKNDSTIYRDFSFGNLLDLIMLDTRITGRDSQINDITSPAMYSQNRSMLGLTQRNWLLQKMSTSKAKWKIIGNQVMFSEFHVGWASQATGQTPAQLENQFLDMWDGYPFERSVIMQSIESQKLNNIAFLTGDIHSAFAFDVADSVTNPSSKPLPYAPSAYDAKTGKGSIAVEFVTPSISSANFDENVGPTLAAGFQFQINNDLPPPFPKGYVPNPHMKYVDLTRHGYFILDATNDTLSANYYFVDKILAPSSKEIFGARPFALNEKNRLQMSNKPAAQRKNQDLPAPVKWQNKQLDSKNYKNTGVSIYPNPANGNVQIQVTDGQKVELIWYDYSGKWVLSNDFKGSENLDVSMLPKGLYFVNVATPNGSWIVKVVLN